VCTFKKFLTGKSGEKRVRGVKRGIKIFDFII